MRHLTRFFYEIGAVLTHRILRTFSSHRRIWANPKWRGLLVWHIANKASKTSRSKSPISCPFPWCYPKTDRLHTPIQQGGLRGRQPKENSKNWGFSCQANLVGSSHNSYTCSIHKEIQQCKWRWPRNLKWVVRSVPNLEYRVSWKYTSHTGAKPHFLSRNSLDFDSSKMWILWKMIFQKCEFCEKWYFRNVNFVKNELSKMWILWNWDLRNVNLVKNWDFQFVNFWIKYGFLPQRAANTVMWKLELRNTVWHWKLSFGNISLPFLALRALNWSVMAVVTVSIMVNILSKPKVKTIMKNIKDITGGTPDPMNSNLAKASGKAMKNRPGPPFTTWSTGTPCWLAMNPSMAKTTKPAKKEVKQLQKVTKMASRWQLLLNLL